METQKPTAGKFAVNYGLTLGMVMVLIAIIMYATGLALKGVQWPQYLYYIIFPVTIIYGIGQFKKANANVLSLGDAIKFGLATAIISALLYAVYVLIFNYIIDPDFMGQMMDVAKEKMLENPNMTPEMAEQSMKWIEKFSNPILGIAFWIALSAIFGLLYSLIGGLVMKKDAE